MNRPTLTTPERLREASIGVAQVVAELQRGLDEHDADAADASFAADVLWGGPFGASVSGYDTLVAIHRG